MIKNFNLADNENIKSNNKIKESESIQNLFQKEKYIVIIYFEKLNDKISRTPIGPFQSMVFAFDISLQYKSTVLGLYRYQPLHQVSVGTENLSTSTRLDPTLLPIAAKNV